MSKRNNYTLLIFFFLQQYLFAQNDNYSFTNLTQEKGLSNSQFHVTLMDKKGFIWLGLQDKLLRWDGRHFKQYITIKDDSTSLSCTFIKDLVEDTEGGIWVATIGGGVCRFDPKTGKFKRYSFSKNDPHSLSDPNVWSLFLDSQGVLWLGTFNAGLCRFNRQTNNFDRFPIALDFKNEEEAFVRNTVRAITEDKSNPNILWLATNDGIAKFDKTSGIVQHFHSTASQTAGLSAYSVVMDKPNELWIGTFGGGIVKFNTLTFNWQYFTPNVAAWTNRNLSNNLIQALLPKNEHELWVCSKDMGFGIFNRQTGIFQFFKNDPKNPLSIGANTANSVYRDAQNHLWVTHAEKGVSIMNLNGLPFSLHDLPVGNCTFYSPPQTTGFVYDVNRQSYFVTSGACDGLFMLDNNKKFIKKIPTAGNEGNYTNYQTVKVGRNGTVWVGNAQSKNALLMLLPNQDKLQPFTHRALPQKAFNVYDIYEDIHKNLWLATDYFGLMQIDFQRDTVIVYVKSDEFPNAPSGYVHVKQIKSDDKGHLWLASQGEGVFCFNPQTQQFKQWLNLKIGFNGMIETRVNALVPDKNGQVWLATSGNGVQILDPNNEKQPIVQQLGTDEGLPSPRINNIVQDKMGNFWVTTEGGVCRYDRETKRFIAYSQSDGIVNNDFYEEGLSVLPNGDIWIGQNNHFYAFDSEKQKAQQSSSLVFSSFKVFEKERFLGAGLNYLENISLNYNENYFTIAFSDLSFPFRKGTLFAYRLEGYDNDWVYPTDNRSEANYTGVPPGHYTFRVKLINAESEGESKEISLIIVIASPWWATIWAYLFYGIMIGLAAYQFYKFNLKQQLRKAETHRLEELNTLKTRLYTNITHEFRTPLTVIMGMAENIQGHDEARKLIQRNSQNLLTLINQLLDLSKLESGQMVLHNIQGDIINYLQYLTESFYSMANDKNIRLTFYAETKELIMDYDEDKIQHIIYNLLSNALKFTDGEGKIILHALQIEQKGKSFLKLKVQDTGIGINQEELLHIFERFYQSDDSSTRKREGTGIGLALTKELVEWMDGTITVDSTLGQGTEFIILLPIKLEAKQKALKTNDLPITTQKAVENVVITEGGKTKTILASNDDEKPLLLIIEDNKDVAFYIQSILNTLYDVRMAKNGQEGIDMAFELIPDIIISDVMMPQKDGYEVCDTLKRDARTSHIPIILLTAKSTMEDKLTGLKVGADVYLMKPFHKEELLIRIDKLLELRRILQKNNARFVRERAVVHDVSNVTAPTLDDIFLGKIRTVIEENLSDSNLGMLQLSQAVSLSHTQVYRKLKAITGENPTHYIRKMRLQHGFKLLSTTEMNISEVAYETGFTDPNYFSRSFSEEFGFPPSTMHK